MVIDRVKPAKNTMSRTYNTILSKTFTGPKSLELPLLYERHCFKSTSTLIVYQYTAKQNNGLEMFSFNYKHYE